MKPKTRHVILIAHGSSDPNWGEPFERLAGGLKEKAPGVHWHLAYMEFQEPSLKAVCGAVGTKKPKGRIPVIPLFFSQGGHVAKDIPALVGEVGRLYPEMEFVLTKPLGGQPEFWRAIGDILIHLSEVRNETNHSVLDLPN